MVCYLDLISCVIDLSWFLYYIYIHTSVGDKDNHKMVLHAAMPLHLMIAICVALGPLEVVKSAWNILTVSSASPKHHSDSPNITQGSSNEKEPPHQVTISLSVRWALFAILCAISAACLYWGCKSHPFLLADNRYEFNVFIYIICLCGNTSSSV